MAHSMDVLVNDFAIRCFRDTADKDYLSARLAYRARLIQPFLWSSLHCLEKYAKGILLLNRIEAQRGHIVLPNLERLSKHGKFEVPLDGAGLEFVKRLEQDGAEYRYYESSYCIEEFDLVRLDNAVWKIRRFCQVLDYEREIGGRKVSMLPKELDRLKRGIDEERKGTCITNGWLEKVLETKGHPARSALVWKNLFFGPSTRKKVRMSPDWEAGNSPLFLHPEVIDKVVKYVFVPGNVIAGARAEAVARRNAASTNC